MPITINGSTGISGVDGSAGTPAYQGTDANTGISFPAADTVAINTGGSERSRVDSSGRLLVGTSSGTNSFDGITPQFQVEGTSYSSSSASLFVNANNTIGAYLVIGKSRGTTVGSSTIVQNGDQIGGIDFVAADGTDRETPAAYIQAFVDGTPGANDMPGRLVFSTTADGASSPTERMRITSGSANGANFLFNCTSIPSASVKGSAIIPNSTGGNYYASATNVTSLYSHVEFYNPNGTVGTIQTNASATAYNTSSDYRLKENIVSIADGITRLQQLKPSRFNFIVSPDHVVDGFIAHEVQEIVPEAISGEKDAVDDDGNPIYQGIDQSKLVPLLTAALQEAISRIETLEVEVAALKTQ